MSMCSVSVCTVLSGGFMDMYCTSSNLDESLNLLKPAQISNVRWLFCNQRCHVN